jgi:hypothetical protein
MSSQQHSPAAEDPVIDLRPVDFSKTRDDGRLAVFQAKIGDIKKTDEPVLALTATMASPAGDEKASQGIQKFLDEVRAGFVVTPLKPDDGGDPVAASSLEGGQGESRDRDDSDTGGGVLFEAELIGLGTGKSPVSVTMIVQNAIGGYTWEERIRFALADVVLWVANFILRLLGQPYTITTLPGSVAYKARHGYTAKPARRMPATVTSKDWCVDVCGDSGQWNQTICKSDPPWAKTTKVVTVTGGTVGKTCHYTVQGDFKLTY